MPASSKFLDGPDRAPLPGQKSFLKDGPGMDVRRPSDEPGAEQRRDCIGIDPGASGGIAVIKSNGEVLLHSIGGSTDKQTCKFLKFVANSPAFAVVEQNTGYVGGAGNPGSAMFKFGVSTGKLLGCLTALDIPFSQETPRAWQKVLGIPPRKKTESKSQFKRRLRQRAEQLFPKVAGITLATCDAVLIAEFNRRKREGTL